MRFVNFGSLNIDYTFGVIRLSRRSDYLISLRTEISGRKGTESEPGSGSGRLRAVSRRFDR